MPTTVTLRNGVEVVLRSPERADGDAAVAFVRQLSRESSRFLNHPPLFFDALTAEAEVGFLESIAAHPRNVMVAASERS